MQGRCRRESTVPAGPPWNRDPLAHSRVYIRMQVLLGTIILNISIILGTTIALDFWPLRWFRGLLYGTPWHNWPWRLHVLRGECLAGRNLHLPSYHFLSGNQIAGDWFKLTHWTFFANAENVFDVQLHFCKFSYRYWSTFIYHSRIEVILH